MKVTKPKIVENASDPGGFEIASVVPVPADNTGVGTDTHIVPILATTLPKPSMTSFVSC